MKKLSTPLIWTAIGAPDNIANNSTFVENARKLFADLTGSPWVKKDGGVTYPGVKQKVKGHHQMHCILREVGDAGGPSTLPPIEPPSKQQRVCDDDASSDD